MKCTLLLFLGQLVFRCSLIKAFCGKMGSFDYACRSNNTLILVSTFPCKSAGLVRLTVIDEKEPNKVYEKETYKDSTLSVGKSKTMVSLKIANHTKGPHAGNVHVFVDIYKLNNEITSRTNVFSAYFFLAFAAECLEGFSGASHYPSPDCAVSLRTGDFSTLCITKNNFFNSSTPTVALLALDPCSHPFSVSTLLFVSGGKEEIRQRYTANKTDEFISLKETSTQGIKMKILYYKEGLQINVVLKIGDSDKTSVEVINDSYFPDDSLMCPNSDCVIRSSDVQSCRSEIITGKGQTKNLSTWLQLGPDGMGDEVMISMRLEGTKNVVNMTLSIHETDEEALSRTLNFNGKSVTAYKKGNGFIPEDGGIVTLHSMTIHEFTHEEDPNAVMVVINRHFPLPSYAFPLLRAEFIIKPKQLKRKSEKRTVAKAIAGVLVFLVIAVVAIVTFVWWRRKRMKSEAGLPYQMELDTEDPDI